MYDVIYEAEIALCNINKQPLQLKPLPFITYLHEAHIWEFFLQNFNCGGINDRSAANDAFQAAQV